MKGKFEHCRQFTEKGKENYDGIKWDSEKPKKVYRCLICDAPYEEGTKYCPGCHVCLSNT